MKISIIVPVYNVEIYLEQCLESLINQSYKDLEIILIDDNSTDNSRTICEEYAKRDSRIVVLCNEENKGVVYTRNVGFQYAHGEYISCVDADDWIDIDAYCKVEEIINAYSPDIILFGYYKEYGNYSEEIKEQVRDGLFKLCELAQQIDIEATFYTPFITQSLWNKVIKKDLIKKNGMDIPRDIKICEDAILVYSCLANASNVYVLDNCFYHYRNRKGSAVFLNNNSDKKSLITCARLISELFHEKNICDERVKKLYFDFVFYYLLLISPDKLFTVDNLKNGLLFPGISENKRIIIYGKGSIGTKLYESIKKTNSIHIITWIDKNDSEKLLNLEQSAYDYILVAVGNAKIVKSIRTTLIDLGIFENKIISFNDMNRDENVLPKEIKKIMEKL